MSHDIRDEGKGSARQVSVAYRWHHREGECAIALRAYGDPAIPATGSIEEFIAKHYCGYGRDRKGRGLEYGVRHDPWRLWTTTEAAFSGNAVPTYGPKLVAEHSQPVNGVGLYDGAYSAPSQHWTPLLHRNGYPLYAICRLPGFNAVFTNAYRSFARNRHCISGQCSIDSSHHI